MTPRRQLLWFLGLVAVAEAVLTWGSLQVDPRGGAGAAIMAGIMWAPGLIALGVQLATERHLRGFGWGLGPARYLAIAYLVPAIYGGIPFAIAVATGNGEWNFTRWAEGAGRWGMTPTVLNGFLIGTAMLLPAILMGLGEEIGWRGFMVPRLRKLGGFWFVVNASYPIWLAFHLPGMFFGGYHGQGTPFWYSLLCFAVLIYPGTVFFTWLRLRSGSIWPCALAHGAHNLFIQMLFALAVTWDGGTPWLVGEFGAVTPVACGVVVAALLWWDRGRVKKERTSHPIQPAQASA